MVGNHLSTELRQTLTDFQDIFTVRFSRKFKIKNTVIIKEPAASRTRRYTSNYPVKH